MGTCTDYYPCPLTARRSPWGMTKGNWRKEARLLAEQACVPKCPRPGTTQVGVGGFGVDCSGQSSVAQESRRGPCPDQTRLTGAGWVA